MRRWKQTLGHYQVELFLWFFFAKQHWGSGDWWQDEGRESGWERTSVRSTHAPSPTGDVSAVYHRHKLTGKLIWKQIRPSWPEENYGADAGALGLFSFHAACCCADILHTWVLKPWTSALQTFPGLPRWSVLTAALAYRIKEVSVPAVAADTALEGQRETQEMPGKGSLASSW